MGMETMLKSGVLISIFVVCIISFAVMFAVDNDSDISLSGDSRFTGLNSTLRGNVATFENDSTSSQEILTKTSLASGDQEISGGGGQFKIGPWTALSMTVSSIWIGFNSIFGNEFTFIITAFISLFTMLMGYYIIKAWLGRDPSG